MLLRLPNDLLRWMEDFIPHLTPSSLTCRRLYRIFRPKLLLSASDQKNSVTATDGCDSV